MANKAKQTEEELDLDNLDLDAQDVADTASGKSGTYDLDHLPKDFQADASERKVYPPLPADVYQVQILNIEAVDNQFFDEKKDSPLNRYTMKATLVIIEDGEFYGRQVWDNFSPTIKPQTKKGPTKAYKFVTAVLDSSMDWDACESFAADFGRNLKSFIGKQLRVTLEVGTKQDGTPKNKVASYMPAKKLLPPFEKESSDK